MGRNFKIDYTVSYEDVVEDLNHLKRAIEIASGKELCLGGSSKIASYGRMVFCQILLILIWKILFCLHHQKMNFSQLIKHGIIPFLKIS